MTPDSFRGESARDHCKFTQDPYIQSAIQPKVGDYKHSGFDKGHLAPMADCKCCLQAQQESCFLSNIAPQNPHFNRVAWNKLESHIRDLTHLYGRVRVLSGPLFLPVEKEDGKKYVSYEVIGESCVAVPTHFFKVIRIGEGSEAFERAYIVPNAQESAEHPIEDFLSTVEKVQKYTGILLTDCS